MDVDAEKWMLNTWFVLNWLIGPLTILCWMLWKRLANGNDREVGTNLRVQQTNASDARIASDTAGPGGLVGPVQISTDVKAVESPRAGEVRQQAQLLKQEQVQNGRESPFRLITPQRQTNLWDDCTPVCPDFSAILRPLPLPRAQDQADQQRQQLNVGFNLPQSSGQNLAQNNDHNQTLNNDQDATTNRDTTRAMRSELPLRIGKEAARKPEVFSESMNIDEWISYF